tara:strand:+ start:249 stop:377 length:129 start_codon:yes stop_codon:yes gene_type:complete
MKTFKQFKEELVPIKKILKGITGKKLPNKPYTQEPGKDPKQV